MTGMSISFRRIFLVYVFGAACAGAYEPLPGPAIPEGLGVNIHFTKPKAGEIPEKRRRPRLLDRITGLAKS